MWVLPSLGRPKMAQKVAEIAAEVPILLRLHWGDPHLDEYEAIKWPKAWKVAIYPQQNLADSLNWAFRKYPNEAQYGFLADDTLPSPENWAKMLEKEAGDWNVAYPDDGHHHEKLCPHHCIGGELMREVGWWALPGLRHSFLDTVWYVIGMKTDALRYVRKVLFDHLHPFFGRGEMDETYVYGHSFYQEDKARFHDWARSKDLALFFERLKWARERHEKGK